MNLPIVYQEDDWLVINKPAGISVHNEPGADVCSFLQQQLSSKIYPVHRLDKDTSGLMICALRNERVVSLQRSLQTGEKTYHAIVRGHRTMGGPVTHTRSPSFQSNLRPPFLAPRHPHRRYLSSFCFLTRDRPAKGTFYHPKPPHSFRID